MFLAVVSLGVTLGCRKAPPPAPLCVAPANGPEAGGTEVTLTGLHFAPGMKVLLGMSNATVVSVSNSTTAMLVTPPHPAGTVNVTVQNPDLQRSVLSNAFTFDPPPKPDVLAQWHFAGDEAVNTTTNGALFKKLRALPESQALLNQTLDKLARAPFARLKTRLGDQTNDCATLLRPLLDDLLRAESYFQIRALSNQPPEWTLAVRLPAERASLWGQNLADTLTAWTGIQPTNTAAGWRLAKHDAPNWFGFEVAGEWALFGAGQDALPLHTELVERIQLKARPLASATNYWLQALVDWPLLTGKPSWLEALRLPRTDLKLIGEGDNLLTRIELTFPQPHGWTHEPWLFPSNLIREPVVSFTAAQGFGERLKPLVTSLGIQLDSAPGQACLWALAEIPFQTFAATPVPDVTNMMAQLCEKLPPWFNTNAQGRALGTWSVPTNLPAVIWEGLPFFGGYLRPAYEETNGGFLFAGLFPNSPRKIPPPPELFLQILGRTNLAYYDWEIGAERLRAWRNMCQLALLLADKPQLPAQSAAMKWIEVASTNLGNIGTSVTVTGPAEMVLSRQSPYGFTGFETVLLANWLESVTFPWGYELPDPMVHERRDKKTGPKPTP